MMDVALSDFIRGQQLKRRLCQGRRKSEMRLSVLTSLDGSGTVLFVYLVSF